MYNSDVTSRISNFDAAGYVVNKSIAMEMNMKLSVDTGRTASETM
jgi:hypothetical protein